MAKTANSQTCICHTQHIFFTKTEKPDILSQKMTQTVICPQQANLFVSALQNQCHWRMADCWSLCRVNEDWSACHETQQFSPYPWLQAPQLLLFLLILIQRLSLEEAHPPWFSTKKKNESHSLVCMIVYIYTVADFVLCTTSFASAISKFNSDPHWREGE